MRNMGNCAVSAAFPATMMQSQNRPEEHRQNYLPYHVASQDELSLPGFLAATQKNTLLRVGSFGSFAQELTCESSAPGVIINYVLVQDLA